MTSNECNGGDLRVGDRITARAGLALSGHNFQPLARDVSIEISSIRPSVGGDVDVTGFVLTPAAPGAPVRRSGPWSYPPAPTPRRSESATPSPTR
jgi:hypothetical protein